MTKRNLPSLDEIAGDPGALKGLPLDDLDALLSEAAAQTTICGAAKKAITSYLESLYAGDIAHAYSIDGKDFGTVHIHHGDYDIEVNTPKKAEWDGEKLGEIGDAMVAAGDDPSEYIDVTYSVQERKYVAWPEHIRKVFEPARTLKPGTRALRLSRIKREAA